MVNKIKAKFVYILKSRVCNELQTFIFEDFAENRR